MATHLLYGLRAGSAAEVASVLAGRLGQAFQGRESHYMGEYWLARTGSVKVKVVTQPDPFGDPVESAFAEYQTLIYVDGEPPTPELDGIQVGSGVLERLR